MERRLLLVFALTFVVIVLFQPILKKYLPQSQAPAPSQHTQSKAQPAPQPASSNQVLAAQAAVPTLNAGATKQATSESETVVENDLYRITFTNRGAQVKSWILKKYDDDKRQPLDLVNNLAAEKYGYPLSLWTYDESQRNKLNSALYVVFHFGAHLNAPAKITFEYADGDIAVRKSFSFDHTYVVHVETSVRPREVKSRRTRRGLRASETKARLPLTTPVKSSISTTATLSGWPSKRSAAAARCTCRSTGQA